MIWTVRAKTLLFAAVLMFWLPFAVLAEGLVTERYWYEDTTGQLDWESVRGKTFLPFEGVLSQGFGATPIWVRLRIDPGASSRGVSSDSDEPLILRVRPSVLDHVELFDPRDIRTSSRVAGDMHPWSEGEYPSLSFAFRIPRGEVPRDLWLRVQSEGTRRVQVEVQTLGEVWKAESQEQLLFSAYLGVMLLFLGFSLIHLFVARDRLVAAFAIKQVFGISVGLVFMGYLRIALDGWMPATWVNQTSNGLLFMFVITGVWFEFVFLSELNPPRWARRLMLAFLVVLPLQMLLMAVTQVQLALNLLFLTLLMLPFLGMLIAFKIRYPKSEGGGPFPLLPQPVLVLTYLARFVLMLLLVLPALGVAETTALPLGVVMLQQFLVGSLMVAVLYVRARRQARSRTQTLTQLAVAEDHVMQERAHREEHQKLLAMLAHELKTPLAAMKMLLSLRTQPPNALATLHRMLADMNNVIERCLQSVRTLEPALALHTKEVDVPLTIRLCLLRTTNSQQIEVTCPSRLTWRTDSQVFQMIVGNLLDNAMKYSPVGSAVQLGVDATDGGGRNLRIWVENDEGPLGVPDPAHLFEKYYRNPLAKRQSGSGLGLYLTHVFVKALGGGIQCQASNGRVRFELWLPS